MKPVNSETIRKYRDHITLLEPFIADLKEIEWLQYNGFEYREHILIIQNGTFHAIKKMFVTEENIFYFLCTPYEILYFDDFLNSYHVKEMCSTTFVLIELAVLKN